jgi:site-specific recombinase XerD
LRHNIAGDLVAAALGASPLAARTFFEFFASTLPNPNTRSAYMRDVQKFFAWCAAHGYEPLTVTPVHLAGYREVLARELEPTSVKRHFSALRSLYAWWVEKGVLTSKPGAGSENRKGFEERGQDART